MKSICRALILFFIMGYAEAAEISAPSVSVAFEAMYISPSCTLIMPHTVDLGIFPKGITEDIPNLFDIEIDCQNSGNFGSYRTWLVASSIASPVDNTQIPLTSGSTLSLFLTEPNGGTNSIIFDGTTKFCINNHPTQENMKCSVSPKIDIPINAGSGFFSSSIIITMGYD